VHPEAVELAEERTPGGKHYRNPDGTRSGVFSPGAVHYRAAPNGPWLEKRRLLVPGSAADEWGSTESDATMRAYRTGTGPNRRWWVEFAEKLTGRGVRFALDVAPAPGSDAPNRLDFGAGWSYHHTRPGGKLTSPPFTSRIGARAYSFAYELTGGAPPLEVDSEGGLLCPGVFSMPRAFALGADGKVYRASPWAFGPSGTVSMTFDDSALPDAALPYRIDPSTQFAVATGGNDASADNAGGFDSTNALIYPYRSPTYLAVGVIKWDTSSLPDGAAIVSATNRLYVSGKQNADGKGLVGEHYVFVGNNAADYTAGAVDDAMAAVPVAGLPMSGSHDFLLRNPALISKSGFSGIRYALTTGVSGENEVQIASFNHSTLPEPLLIVDYATQQTKLAPDALVSMSGLSGTVAAIQDDPDDPDASWLTVPADPSEVNDTVANQYAASQNGGTPSGFAGQLTNPANAVGSGETSQATSTGATQNSDYGTYFGFAGLFDSIPDAGAAVVDVTLEVRQWASSASRGTVGWRLDTGAGTNAGSPIANELTKTTLSTAAPAAGSPRDSYAAWSQLPTVAQLKAPGFRVRCRWRRTASQASTYTLDWLRLTVAWRIGAQTVHTEARVSFPSPGGTLETG
jgi:hypothetical protein